MQKEKVFSKEGSYELCLRSNALMHREFTELICRTLANVVPLLYQQYGMVSVLDLACGAMPVSLSGALSQFPDVEFEYTGIDINTDQIDQLTRFDFPSNVRRVTAIAGNAWDLKTLREHELENGYHIVFSGFNLHHGTPEELFFLASQLKNRLVTGGIFLNVDAYRPETEAYTRRPDVNPNDSSESYHMVSPEHLTTSYQFTGREQPLLDSPQWKLSMCRELRRIMADAGGEVSQIDEVINHSMERDFPLSLAEAVAIFTQAGFQVTGLPMQNHYPDTPIAEFFGALVAKLT